MISVPSFWRCLLIPRSDRLWWSTGTLASRFGVAYIQTLLAMQGRELVIVNTADTAEDDLRGDFVALVTSFCARLYGRRRAKRKTEQVLAALQQNGLIRESEARESH
jgi:putative resolvase